MSIVLKWNFRTLLSDVPRFILTILSIAGAFAMLTAMGLALESHMLAIGSLNEGIPKTVVALLQPTVLVAFALTLYVLFAVSLAERKSQFHLMRTAGTTTRQLLHGLFAEAMALDAAGAALGVGLGFLFAWLLLQSVDVPLHPEVFWNSAVFLRGVLPAFALVPVMMLANAPVLLWEKRSTRRKKPLKKLRSPFRTRLLPRLFGAGGSLEYALGKQQRRHRVLLVAAIVINVVALFLVTAGYSILSHMEIDQPSDMEIRFSNSSNVNYGDAVDYDGLQAGMEQLLNDCRDEGLLTEAVHFQYCCYLLCVFDDEYLTEEALAELDPTKDFYVYLYRLNDRQHCSGFLTQILFLENDEFERYLLENNVSYSGSGGVFINNCLVNGERVSVLACLPDVGGITLYPYPERFYEVTSEADAAKTNMLSDKAEQMLAEEKESMVVRPGGLFNKWRDSFYLQYGRGGSSFELVLPFSEKEAFSALINACGGVLGDRYYVKAKDTTAFYSRLHTALDGKYGYTFRSNHFGDGEEFAIPKKYTEETWQQLVKSIDIYDYQSKRNDLGGFLSQMTQIYRFFTVMVFLMIALNVVNVVHMNRLSRRREYAILLSLGLNKRQRLGMTLFESFRLTAGAVLCSVAALILAARFLYPYFGRGFQYENMTASQMDYLYTDGYYNLFDELLLVAKDLWLTISLSWPLIVFAVLFLFFGFVLAEYIALKRMEKDELVLVLKDDMHE